MTAAILPALAVALLWMVHLVGVAYDIDLGRYGILPRHLGGLPGILLAPFIHGDLEHLFNNSLPVLFLGWGLMYFYPRIALRVTLATWLLGGAWVWISARGNYHIGASGVVYGLAAFLFLSGVLRRQRTLMALSLLVAFLYGSMVWGIFPIVPRISWESHLWGAVAGAVMAVLHRKVPPAVQDPVRPQDDDDDDDDGAPAPAPPMMGRMSTTARVPLRIVYHHDPGDEVDDAELAWRRDLADRDAGMAPDDMADTWFDDEEPRY